MNRYRHRGVSRSRSESVPTTVLHTTRVMYLLWGGLLLIPFASAVVVAWSKRPSLWPLAALMGLVFVGYMYWLATTRLILTDDAIHYRSLLVRVDVPLRDVVKAVFARGFVPFSYQPYFRIILTLRDGSGSSKEKTLNAGLFDMVETQRWVNTLNSMIRT